MDRRKLPLSALRAFESAAEHLNLSSAGKQLGVTHGAISHQIKSLEEYLLVQLFSRENNRLALTPAGSRLYEAVNKGFNTIIDGTRNLNPQDLSGQLIIAATQTTASLWAVKPICEFAQKYPEIEVVVREIKPLQRDIPVDVDFAICYGEPNNDSRQVDFFAAPKLHPVCNPILLQGRGAVSRAQDLLQFPIIHDQEVMWSRWFQHHDETSKCADYKLSFKHNLHFPNTSQALNAAKLGFGVALGNEFETKQAIRDGDLIRLLDMPIDEEHRYYILRQKQEYRPLKAKVFEDWLNTKFKDAC